MEYLETIRHVWDGIMDLPSVYVPDSQSELSSVWVRSRQIETCSGFTVATGRLSIVYRQLLLHQCQLTLVRLYTQRVCTHINM